MPFNGSGSYSLPSNSWNPAVSATNISSSDWNSTASDLATALSTCITKDGQTTTTQRIPFAAGASFGAAIIYGGVTLSNSVTGTGSMVLDTSPTISTPTLSGTTTAAGLSGFSADLSSTDKTISLSGANYLTVAGSASGGLQLRGDGTNGKQAINIAGGSSGIINFVTSGNAYMTISSAGVWTWTQYGTGSIISTSGVITSTSDKREKDFVSAYERGLPEILAIAGNAEFMGNYRWKEGNKTGAETELINTGFFASDKFPIPEAAPLNPKTDLHTLFERPIIMALCNAVATLEKRLSSVENRVAASE